MEINEKDFLSFITTKESLDDTSIKTCRNTVNRLFKWLNKEDLTKQSLEKYFVFLKEKNLKNNTLNNYLFAFRHLKNYCIDRNFDSSFLDGFKSYKKNQPVIIIYTVEEVAKILSTHLEYGNRNGKDCSFLDFVYLTLTMFLAYTGCRPEEAFSLKVKYLDLSAGSVQFVDTKTDKNRTNYFTDPLRGRLRELIKNKTDEDYVFTNSLETRVNAQVYREDLTRRAKKAGITKRTFPYNFRHSYITHQLEVGVEIQVVANLVGHADIQTTYKNYMHLADQTRRKAAMRHPLVRKNIGEQEILKQIEEFIEGYHLNQDKRFSYSITEKGISVSLK